MARGANATVKLGARGGTLGGGLTRGDRVPGERGPTTLCNHPRNLAAAFGGAGVRRGVEAPPGCQPAC
eukprot:6036928-Lingulodinium_polyedra.AAC.1